MWVAGRQPRKCWIKAQARKNGRLSTFSGPTDWP